MKKSVAGFLLAAAGIWGALAAEKTPTWTILLYGHGDHNLSGSLANDLRKIEEVGSSDTFRIVGQVDFDASRVEDNDEAGLPAALDSRSSSVRSHPAATACSSRPKTSPRATALPPKSC